MGILKYILSYPHSFLSLSSNKLSESFVATVNSCSCIFLPIKPFNTSVQLTYFERLNVQVQG